MKKNVLVFGTISGLVSALLMVCTTMWYYKDSNFDGSMALGYASMLIAFAFVLVGVKNYRDKSRGGIITFMEAFKLGLFISLVSSTFYVATWLVEYYVFIPDFMEKAAANAIKSTQESGADAAAMAKVEADMQQYREWYKNPVMVVLLTYAEVVPVGLLVSIVSALILKRKNKKQADTTVA